MEYGLQHMDNIDDYFYIIKSWDIDLYFELKCFNFNENVGRACFHKTLATEVTEHIQNEVRSQVTAINEEFK